MVRKQILSSLSKYSIGYSVVANRCVKMMSPDSLVSDCERLITFSQSDTNESWHCQIGTGLCHQGRNKVLLKFNKSADLIVFAA